MDQAGKRWCHLKVFWVYCRGAMCALVCFTNKKLGVMLLAYYLHKMSKLHCYFEWPRLRRVFMCLHAPAKENLPMHAQNKKSNGVTPKRQCDWLRGGTSIASRFILRNVSCGGDEVVPVVVLEGLGGRAGMGTSVFLEKWLIWLCACRWDVHRNCQNWLVLPAKCMAQWMMPPGISGN